MRRYEVISSYYDLLYGTIDMSEELRKGDITSIGYLFHLQYNHVRRQVTGVTSDLKFSISIRIDCDKREIALVSLSSFKRLKVAEEVLDVVKYL